MSDENHASLRADKLNLEDEPVGDVDQPVGGDSLFYEVATGMLGPDTRYVPHGHVLVLRVNGAFGGG